MPWQPSDVDPTAIPNKDADKHYRWIDWTSPQRFQGHLRSYGDRPGYTLVQGKTVKDTIALCVKYGLPESMVDKSKNQIIWGQNALAWLPKAEHERRVREFARTTASAARDIDEQYVESVNAQGRSGLRAKIFEGGDEEVSDRKAHATREGNPVVSMASGGSAA